MLKNDGLKPAESRAEIDGERPGLGRLGRLTLSANCLSKLFKIDSRLELFGVGRGVALAHSLARSLDCLWRAVLGDDWD